LLCQLYFRLVLGSHGSRTVMSVIYRNLSRVSRVFYSSTLVGYIVSLETRQRSVLVSNLSGFTCNDVSSFMILS